MKKFLITLFFLVVIGGIGFLLGWVQLTVPPGSYGVIQSKTHGVDGQPVQSGEFRWVWYKLIPTNVQISVFHLEPVKFPIEFESILPSGNVYASFSGLGLTDFSWSLKGEISFSIDPEMLIYLVSELKIADQDALDAYIEKIAQEMKVIILQTLSNAETDTERVEKILAGSTDAEMVKQIKARFPEVQGFSFVLVSARYPDFVLYREVRLLYEDFLSKQREYITAGSARRAEIHIEAQFHFWELEQYGELLTKYPVLLEYLAMNLDKKE